MKKRLDLPVKMPNRPLKTENSRFHVSRRGLETQRNFFRARIDGPLRPGLVVNANECRAAESILMAGKFGKRGKPGSTNSGSGPALDGAATALAMLIQSECVLKAPSFTPNIGVESIAEAFPNLFLGVLCTESGYPERPARNRNWTCALYPLVKASLESLLKWLLPGRVLKGDFDLHDHEHIAAYICSLTALCAMAGEYAAVGDPVGGYIYLPPVCYWAAPGIRRALGPPGKSDKR